VTELRSELDGLLRAEAYISTAVESAAEAEAEGVSEETEADARVRGLRRQVLALRRALYTLARASTPSTVVQQAMLRAGRDESVTEPIRVVLGAVAANAPLPTDALEPPVSSPDPAASDRLARRRAELDSRLGTQSQAAPGTHGAQSARAGSGSGGGSGAAGGGAGTAQALGEDEVANPASSSSSAADTLFSLVFAPSVLVASTLTFATDAVLGLVGLDGDDVAPGSPTASPR
jgi:hypothetical protein